MALKSIFTIIIISLFITSCSTKQLSEDDVIEGDESGFFVKKELNREAISPELLNNISHILFLLKQNDLDELNYRFINKKYGFYEVFKNTETNKIYFDKKFMIDEISNEIDSFEIKEEEDHFDCSPNDDAYYGWNKEGVFISTNTKPYLSNIMKEANLININTYSKEDIKIANFIEKTSYEVIISNNIVFYFTKINKKWYITLIDKVKTDCSN